MGAPGGNVADSVWSPAGGPYSNPIGWRRNTALTLLGIAVCMAPIYYASAKLEQRPVMPARFIPSQLWCKNFGDKAFANTK
mmetsp:Transcript_1274/g.4491  ORF Transcript_1274/g.4491 Transcript_1274/m.4491 type:complete len:81 (-) Transcript_1274:275-517(-)